MTATGAPPSIGTRAPVQTATSRARRGYGAGAMDDEGLLDLLHATADAVRAALDATDDWGLADTRPGQYRSDLAADEAAVAHLVAEDVGVLSEESGRHHPDR